MPTFDPVRHLRRKAKQTNLWVRDTTGNTVRVKLQKPPTLKLQAAIVAAMEELLALVGPRQRS